MDNIYSFSDNSYIREVIPLILKDINRDSIIGGGLSVFLFEKTWLSEAELSLILNNKSERVVILARPSLIGFLSTLILPYNIYFGRFDIPLHKLRSVLSRLIHQPINDLLATRRGINPPRNKLSPAELEITLLYVQGISVENIAESMNKSYKTISHHKRSAMKKMGISSNVELMQKGRVFLMMNQEFMLAS